MHRRTKRRPRRHARRQKEDREYAEDQRPIAKIRWDVTDEQYYGIPKLGGPVEPLDEIWVERNFGQSRVVGQFPSCVKTYGRNRPLAWLDVPPGSKSSAADETSPTPQHPTSDSLADRTVPSLTQADPSTGAGVGGACIRVPAGDESGEGIDGGARRRGPLGDIGNRCDGGGGLVDIAARASASAAPLSMAGTRSGARLPLVPHRKKPGKGQCCSKSFANAMALTGHPSSGDSLANIGEALTLEGGQAYVNSKKAKNFSAKPAHRLVPKDDKGQPLRRLTSYLQEQAAPGGTLESVAIVATLLDDKGSADHAITIAKGMIFDSDETRALPMTSASLDRCVAKDRRFAAIDDAVLVYQPKKTPI